MNITGSNSCGSSSQGGPPIHAAQVGFIAIGVQKAATSWLHDMLHDHPEIATSNLKELDFFTNYYNRGYDWYEAQFADGQAFRLRGECSPSYFFSLDAPDRVKLYNSDMRIVCILRDPVERAFSNHLHEIRKGHIPETVSFEDALSRNPTYFLQGQYADHISRWISAFGRERILVLLAEEIALDPVRLFNEVCAHIGVESDFIPEGIAERRHESVSAHRPGLQKVLRGFGDSARAVGLAGAVANVKAAPGVRRLLAMNRRDLRKEIPPMRPETARMLATMFASDARFVAELLGRTELPWRSCDGAHAAGTASPRAGGHV